MFLCTIRECSDVFSLLLLSRDVETNPGPKTSLRSDAGVQPEPSLADIMTLLQNLNTRSQSIEKGQAGLIKSVDEIKKNQRSIKAQVADICTRLSTLESRSVALDDLSREFRAMQQTIQVVRKENITVAAPVSDFEDRLVCDNLIFHGISGSPSESWCQTEQKLTISLLECANFQLNPDNVERAHRLGLFHANKCRPIIIKFSSFKIREKVLLLRSSLRASRVSDCGDYCPETRLAKRKLIEFGKTPSSVFSITVQQINCKQKMLCL